jgi:hypothetical protein
MGVSIWIDDYNLALYSTHWAQGGLIIEREKIGVWLYGVNTWKSTVNKFKYEAVGHTPLIAAMRCYVTSKLGYEIELPEELCLK